MDSGGHCRNGSNVGGMNRNVACAALTLLLAASARSEPSQPKLLMGHFGPTEMAQVEAKGLTGSFDMAVDGGQQQYPRGRSRILGAGKGLVTYFNIHDVQPEVVRGEWRAPWYSFLANTVLARWGAVLTNAAGDTAFYAYYGGDRVLLNWAVIGWMRAEVLVQARSALPALSRRPSGTCSFPTLPRGCSPNEARARVDTGCDPHRLPREHPRALRIARRTFSRTVRQSPSR